MGDGKLFVCCLLTPNATLIERQKPEGHIDQTDSDFDEIDAQLVLEAARTRRTVCRLEQELAEARYAESTTLAKLYKHRAEDAKKRQEYAEFDLGLARERMTSNSNVSDLSIVRRPNAKRPRISSPSENQLRSKYHSLCLCFSSSAARNLFRCACVLNLPRGVVTGPIVDNCDHDVYLYVLTEYHWFPFVSTVH